MKLELFLFPGKPNTYNHHLLSGRVTNFFGKVFQQWALGARRIDKHKKKRKPNMPQITNVESLGATFAKTLFFFFLLWDGSCSFKTFFFLSVVQASGFIITSAQMHKSDQTVNVGS